MIPVNITGKALVEIKSILKNKNIPAEYGLRIGIKGAGGCVGISYMLGFDLLRDDDDVFDFEGLQVYIAKKHLMYLIGLAVDYHSGTDSQGFSFVKAEAR